MQKITPHLWFNNEAEEAAQLYTSLFKDSKIGSTTRYTEAGQEIHGQAPGTIMTIEFELAGHKFLGLNGGPIFKFNPSISFLVGCETKEEVDELWSKLSEGGMPLMELGEYPFSQRYGWIQDKFGVSWQLMFMGDEKIEQKIIPTIMFIGDMCGKAEEAMNRYVSIFDNSSIGEIARYEASEGPDKPGTVMHGQFILAGQRFAAMDSAYEHKFALNEAISLMISCETQEEIDYFWDKLTEGGDPQAQQCGWLKDKYGVSWQVAPTILSQLLTDSDPEKVKRVTNTFMKMKKLDIAELKKASEG